MTQSNGDLTAIARQVRQARRIGAPLVVVRTSDPFVLREQLKQSAAERSGFGSFRISP